MIARHSACAAGSRGRECSIVATNVYLNLFGVGGASASHPDRGRIEVRSATWGFDRTPGGGTFEYDLPIVPTVLTATMRSLNHAPQLMKRFLTRAVSSTGLVVAYQPNVQGVEKQVLKVTLYDVTIVQFKQHTDGHDSLDTVQLMFSGLDYEYPPGPTAKYRMPA